MAQARILLVVLIALLALGLAGAPAALADPTGLNLALTTAQEKIQQALDDMDRLLDRAAMRLHATSPDAEKARLVLEEVFFGSPHGLDLLFIDPDGVVRLAVPDRYRGLEGTSLAGQPQVKRLFETSQPVLGPVIQAVEGFQAVALQHPVVDANGRVVGALSLLFKPGSLLGKVMDPMMSGLPGDCWVIDTNGLILFDPDPEEIGRELFTDPLYQPFGELLALGRRIAATAGGEGEYRFLGKGLERAVTKRARWATVGLHGVYWRVVMTEVSSQLPVPARRTPGQLGLARWAEGLKALAVRPDLVQAAATGDSAGCREILGRFHDANPGLYSVQWLDATGVVRAGYPRAGSLEGRDLHAEPSPLFLPFLKALAERKPVGLEGPMEEGGRAQFQLEPVWQGGRYLGMIYYIRLLP